MHVLCCIFSSAAITYVPPPDPAVQTYRYSGPHDPVQLVEMGLITPPQEPIPLSEQHLGAQMLLAL